MPKKNNALLRKWKLILTLITLAVGLLIVFESHLDSTVASHPKIVRIEVTQEYIVDKLDTVLSKQDVFMDVLNDLRYNMEKLTREEYGGP